MQPNLKKGFASGAFLLLAPVYITEIAEPSLRGALGNGLTLAVTLGQATVNALSINKFLSWIEISAVAIVAPGGTKDT